MNIRKVTHPFKSAILVYEIAALPYKWSLRENPLETQVTKLHLAKLDDTFFTKVGDALQVRQNVIADEEPDCFAGSDDFELEWFLQQ